LEAARIFGFFFFGFGARSRRDLGVNIFSSDDSGSNKRFERHFGVV
jgi:hypothetical protein